MTAEERRRRLTGIGYRLVRSYPCPIRRKRVPYATLPEGSGPTCVHDSLADVERYIIQVEQIRGWQDG